jgi:predicted Zn-dependent protease
VKRPGILVMAVVLWLGVALAAPRRSKTDQETPVAVASLLIREGDWARAADLLGTVDPAAKGVDRVRYHTLVGLVHLHDKQGGEAARAFEAALAEAAEGRELLELHLSRAYLAAGRPAEAILALDRSGDVGANLAGTWLLRAQAQEATGDPDAAWAALAAGSARFPAAVELRRQQVFLLVRLGLFREARALGEALLARPDADADDAVAISEALRRGGDTEEALVILEAALLEEGEDRDLLVQAARASLDADQPRSAARFLERAAVLDPTLYLEASEAYRRAGDLLAAERLNAQVVDPPAKARQRLGLLLDAEAWERAVALEERVSRLGLAEDDGVAYGMAYAWFKLGDYPRAAPWLANIREPEAFRRASALREAIAACDAQGGCL